MTSEGLSPAPATGSESLWLGEILAMFYTYVLYSKKDKKLYTGSTNNIEERLKRHNKGLVTVTKNRRPFTLLYYEACLSRKDSMKREMYLKTSWGKAYLKNRLTDSFKKLIGSQLSSLKDT